jgi:hypothetical protein
VRHNLAMALRRIRNTPTESQMKNRPKPPPLDETQLEKKLAGARQRVRNLIVIGMNPGVSADMREAAHKMESWTREQVRVHSRVLADFRARLGRPRRLP